MTWTQENRKEQAGKIASVVKLMWFALWTAITHFDVRLACNVIRDLVPKLECWYCDNALLLFPFHLCIIESLK